MPFLLRTDSTHPDFVALVALLDANLALRDGEDHAYYAQFNKIDLIRHAVLAYEGEEAVGCGAIKAFGEKAMEVKRMYTLKKSRGMGIASLILAELEAWTIELGYTRCVLETGKRQPEAIALYQKRGYQPIPNYGQYIGVDNSCCFEKHLVQP